VTMDYHQMTMHEARDSPARRKQFLVTCTVMAGMFTHGMMTGGAFSSLNIKEGVFPGGTFVFKYATRYAHKDRAADITENTLTPTLTCSLSHQRKETMPPLNH
jgi:hypothetical protein